MLLIAGRQQRKRVKYATQLFSKSCALSLRYLGEKGLLNSKNWKVTSEFINLINDWFDIMNSSHMYGDTPTRNAFGLDMQLQMDTLNKITNVMSSMKVKSLKVRSLYKFQKGVILSCKSVVGLFHMLRDKYNLKYLLTRRMNQDPLEQLFGCIRQVSGPYDHPTPVEFKFRLRTLLIGKDATLVCEKTSTSAQASSLDPSLTNGNCEELIHNSKERETSLELCLTSLMFRNLEFESELQEINDEEGDLTLEDDLNKTATMVIEEEVLRYIGSYIVKKFTTKYPHLGTKTDNNVIGNKTWIETVNRGGPYMHSKEKFTQLTISREVFNAIYGQSLVEGR